MEKKTKKNGTPASGRKVEKPEAGRKGAGAGADRAGAVKAKKPEAAKAPAAKPEPKPEPVKVKCSPAQAKADNAAIQAEAAKIAAMKKVIMAFVSTDVTRKSLQAPYHDKPGRVVVATDGRGLLATRYGYNANVKDRDFPRWRQVVPNYEKGEKGITTLAFNPGNLLAICRNAKRLAGAIGTDKVYIRFPLAGKGAVGVSLENAARLAAAMCAGGLSELKANGDGHALMASDDNTTVVVMPIRGYTDIPGRTAQDGIAFDGLSGRCIYAPESSITDYIKARAKELAENRDALSKKELSELAKLEKQIEAEAEIDALITPEPGKPAQAAQKPAQKPAKPEKPSAQPEAAKPAQAAQAAQKPAQAARDPFDFSADLPEWRKIAKTDIHEARAQVATWAALLPVSDDSNVVFTACLDTFASVAYLLEKAGRRIVALEKMSDDAAKTFKGELSKVVTDAKALAALVACL